MKLFKIAASRTCLMATLYKATETIDDKLTVCFHFVSHTSIGMKRNHMQTLNCKLLTCHVVLGKMYLIC